MPHDLIPITCERAEAAGQEPEVEQVLVGADERGVVLELGDGNTLVFDGVELQNAVVRAIASDHRNAA